MENKEMELKVAEAFSQADVGRSIARIRSSLHGKTRSARWGHY